MNKKTVAKLLQRALDYVILHFSESACKYGLCIAVDQMRQEGYFTGVECNVLHKVINDLLDEWQPRCTYEGRNTAYLWVGIAVHYNMSRRTEQIFPIWRQVYGDKIKELETGVHHG